MPDKPIEPEDVDMACDAMMDFRCVPRCPRCGCTLECNFIADDHVELYCIWCGYMEAA